MKPKLFHTLVIVGATMTGAVGIAVVPAAIVTLTGCGGHPVYGAVDFAAPDLNRLVLGSIDAAPILEDLSSTDGAQDAGA